jgi:hypothetical protein
VGLGVKESKLLNKDCVLKRVVVRQALKGPGGDTEDNI